MILMQLMDIPIGFVCSYQRNSWKVFGMMPRYTDKFLFCIFCDYFTVQIPVDKVLNLICCVVTLLKPIEVNSFEHASIKSVSSLA
jgi:hypothetical protein